MLKALECFTGFSLQRKARQVRDSLSILKTVKMYQIILMA